MPHNRRNIVEMAGCHEGPRCRANLMRAQRAPNHLTESPHCYVACTLHSAHCTALKHGHFTDITFAAQNFHKLLKIRIQMSESQVGYDRSSLGSLQSHKARQFCQISLGSLFSLHSQISCRSAPMSPDVLVPFPLHVPSHFLTVARN